MNETHSVFRLRKTYVFHDVRAALGPTRMPAAYVARVIAENLLSNLGNRGDAGPLRALAILRRCTGHRREAHCACARSRRSRVPRAFPPLLRDLAATRLRGRRSGNPARVNATVPMIRGRPPLQVDVATSSDAEAMNLKRELERNASAIGFEMADRR